MWGKTAGAAAWQEKVFAVLFSVGGACVLFTCAFLKQGAEARAAEGATPGNKCGGLLKMHYGFGVSCGFTCL